MTPLSIFLITRNEADRLGPTLEAVRHLTDDLVVVDSGSTDATLQVAEQYGARIIHHDWQGYGPQKRFAEEQCRHLWLLNLDADERVPPELAQEIQHLMSGRPECDAYRLRIAEMFPGESAPHPWAYALSPVRLYRKDKGRYASSPVHDRVELAPQARIGRLKGTVHHLSVRSLGDQIDKLNRYSTMQAYDLAARGQKISLPRAVMEFPLAFLKAYLLRRHIVRGRYGFLTAMNYAISRHLRVAKAIEQQSLSVKKTGD